MRACREDGNHFGALTADLRKTRNYLQEKFAEAAQRAEALNAEEKRMVKQRNYYAEQVDLLDKLLVLFNCSAEEWSDRPENQF